MQKNVVRAAERRLAAAPAPSRRAQTADGEAHLLDIGRVRPNPQQPRTDFKLAEIAELAASLRRDGQLQPIVVRPLRARKKENDAAQSEPSDFEIIMGERRWRAAQEAGLAQIRAIVREVDDDEALRLALIENIQRVDLNAVDKAAALERLKKVNPGLPWTEIGSMLGLTKQSILNLVGLLKLPPDIQQQIRAGKITEKHGRALRRLPEPDQHRLLGQIHGEKLTGEQTLKRAQHIKARHLAPPAATNFTATNLAATASKVDRKSAAAPPVDRVFDPLQALLEAEQHAATALASLRSAGISNRLLQRKVAARLARLRTILAAIDALQAEPS